MMSAPVRSKLEALGLSASCAEVLAHLWDYLDEQITPTSAERLQAHIATCVGIDVVDILGKRRTPPDRLVVDAFAERRAAHPRRVELVRLTFTVDGSGIEIEPTERAVALALEKYCSVAATLASDVVVETAVVANGVAAPIVRRAGGDPVR